MPTDIPRPALCTILLLLLLVVLVRAPSAGAQAGAPPGGRAGAPTPERPAPEALEDASAVPAYIARMLGWTGFVQGGYVHRFATRGEDGGSSRVDRFFVQAGVTYMPDLLRSVSLALGYGFDGFRFSGDSGLAGLRPWATVHTFSVSLPVRWGFAERWTLFAIPTVRAAAEDGARVKDAFLGGGIGGFTYRFGDRLTLGPGIGVMTEIEDAPSVFPVLLVDWKITEKLSLSTGRGAGASLGPGLLLSYTANRKWSFSLAGRYERLRFRLDGDGPSPGGVGEDRSFPLYASVTYSFFPMGRVSLLAGVGLAGEQRMEDARGNRVARGSYDPAPFVGLSFSVRF